MTAPMESPELASVGRRARAERAGRRDRTSVRRTTEPTSHGVGGPPSARPPQARAESPLSETSHRSAAALARRVLAVSGAVHVGVALLDDRRRQLDVIASAGPAAAQIPAGEEVPLTGTAREAVADGRPWVVTRTADGTDDVTRRLAHAGLEAAALLPFATGLPVAGVLLLGWMRSGPVDEATLARARAVLHGDLPTLQALLLAEHEHRRARELHELLTFREDMVQTVAHDLATPVGVVSGFARLVRQGRGDEQDLDRWMAAIARNAVELETLVGNLRDIMRIERGPLPAGTCPFDLEALCHELVDDLELTTGRDIEFRPAAARALGDPELTRRVLQNLLSNAQKYSGPGTPIEVGLAREETRVKVHVRDHGPGIPEDRRAGLFERFTRLNLEEHADVRGTGLGLYISRVLTEAQGGAIWLDSEPGEGATFTVALPRQPDLSVA
jgi:signal transduction histidine kinase